MCKNYFMLCSKWYKDIENLPAYNEVFPCFPVPQFSRRPERDVAIMSKYYDGVEFPFCDEFSKYEKLAKIGQGTFGYVQIHVCDEHTTILLILFRASGLPCGVY